MIRVQPAWCDAHSNFASFERLNTVACITYLMKRGWLPSMDGKSPAERFSLVFEGCGVAEAECRLICDLLERGILPVSILFLDKDLTTATIENVRSLPAAVHLDSQIYLTQSYANVTEFVRASPSKVLVIGIHAGYTFDTEAEREVYIRFCETCAACNVQPECINFQADPTNTCASTRFHPVDANGTWAYSEPWAARVERLRTGQPLPQHPTL